MKSIKIIHYLLYITLICTFFFITCSKDRKKIIPEEQFIEILSDIMIVDNLALPQAKKVELVKTIFVKYEITPALFDSTKSFYKNDAEFWIKVYKRTQEHIKERKSL